MNPGPAADWWDGAFAPGPFASGAVARCAQAWCREGTALFEAGRPAAAIGCLARGLRVDPEMSGAAYGWAVCLLALGQWRGAATVLQWEINGDRPHARSGSLLAELLARISATTPPVVSSLLAAHPYEPALALETVQSEARAGDPERIGERLLAEAAASAQAGRFDETIETLERLEALFPDQVELRALRLRLQGATTSAGQVPEDTPGPGDAPPPVSDASPELARLVLDAHELLAAGRAIEALQGFLAVLRIDQTRRDAWVGVAGVAESLGDAGLAARAREGLARLDGASR